MRIKTIEFFKIFYRLESRSNFEMLFLIKRKYLNSLRDWRFNLVKVERI